MIIFEDVGNHPNKPTARHIVEYDDDANTGTEFSYYGFPRDKVMHLYPADKFTVQKSRKKKVLIRRIRRKK